MSADIQSEIDRLKSQPGRLELLKSSGVLEEDKASEFLDQPSPLISP